jgi:hypothetical protein
VLSPQFGERDWTCSGLPAFSWFSSSWRPLRRAPRLEEQYGTLLKDINDDAARASIKLALTKITSRMCLPEMSCKTSCESARPCSPATQEEFARPPVTIADARRAMAFGIKSALALWCGLGNAGSYELLQRFARGQK